MTDAQSREGTACRSPTPPWNRGGSRRSSEQRPRLLGIAYRILGTLTAADDVLQEAGRRWSAVKLAPVADREALLTTIVTRLSLDRLRRERVRREAYAGPWLPELVADEPPTPGPGRQPPSEPTRSRWRASP